MFLPTAYEYELTFINLRLKAISRANEHLILDVGVGYALCINNNRFINSHWPLSHLFFGIMVISGIFLLLIAIFYDKTDGFMDEPNRMRYSILKSFPVLHLAAAVYLGYGNLKGRKRHILSTALLAGACGDFLISACRDMEISFAMSAIVFGIGHLLYMAGFVAQLKRLSTPLLAIVTFYGIFMNYRFLLPNFGNHPITTSTLMAYSIILSVALLISGSLVFEGTRFQPPKQKNNVLRFIGYALFFISDSLLLLEHAGLDFPCCKELLILTTYYAAQFAIMKGAIETEEQFI